MTLTLSEEILVCAHFVLNATTFQPIQAHSRKRFGLAKPLVGIGWNELK